MLLVSQGRVSLGLIIVFCLLPAAFPMAAGEWVHPFDVAQSSSFPKEIRAVIEIPAGTHTKYEIDKQTGYVEADRFVSMPMAYPANYGALPQTRSGDGDTLDVLVLTRAPLHPGVFITVRPIGYLKMIDGGEADDKVLAVPTTKVDPTFEPIHEISDLPAIETQRLEAFFRVYKQLPDGRKKIELKGWSSAKEAHELLLLTHKNYLEAKKR